MCPTIASPTCPDTAETSMPTRESPTVRRRRLSQRLRKLREYAEAIIRCGATTLTDEQVQTRIDIRMRRQQALHEDPALEVIAVIDEAALRREVGGSDVMRAQLRHLRQAAQLPNVTVQVIPY